MQAAVDSTSGSLIGGSGRHDAGDGVPQRRSGDSEKRSTNPAGLPLGRRIGAARTGVRCGQGPDEGATRRTQCMA